MGRERACLPSAPSVELADETGHRALFYVAAVQRQGYALMIDEFEEYIRQPQRTPGVPPREGQRVPAHLAPALRLSEQVRRSLLAVVPTVEVGGSPGRPGESVLSWLTRLSWLDVDNGRVRITPLGTAVLGALEQQSLEMEAPLEIVLDQGDPFAVARVIGEVADLGRCALVDPYFNMDRLLAITQLTGVERLLTGPRGEKRLTELAVALDAVDVDRPFEVRKVDVFHDRYAIPEGGPLLAIGSSLGHLGTRFSGMVRLAEGGSSDAIRAKFEEAWERRRASSPCQA